MSLSADTALHKPVTLPPALERNRLLDVFQMADLLGFSVAHVRRMYRTGKLPGARPHRWPQVRLARARRRCPDRILAQ